MLECLQQLRERQAQMLRDVQQRIQPRDRLTALQKSDLSSVQSAIFGKLLLREPLALAFGTNAFAEHQENLLQEVMYLVLPS